LESKLHQRSESVLDHLLLSRLQKKSNFCTILRKKAVFSLFFKVFDVENWLRTSHETLKSGFL
jgi:hypothetical protein